MRSYWGPLPKARIAFPLVFLVTQSVRAIAADNSVSLNVTPNPALYGMPVSITATVSPATATGTITFYNGVSVLGVAALSSGAATLSTTLLPSGTLSLQARYNGDSSNAASLSPVFVETVNALGGNGFAASPGSPWATVGPADPLYPGGRFEASAPAIADFNSDGHPDLAVVNTGGTVSVSVLLGDGNGGFSAQPAIPIAGTQCPSSTSSRILAGDFNNDGNADLVFNFESCGPPGQSYISLWLGDGNGGFTPINIPVANGTTVVAAADFNGDGNLDLAVASPAVGNPIGPFATLITIWLGNGQGRFPVPLGPFKAPLVEEVQAALALDFNGDGYPDIALIDFTGNFSLLVGDGSGTLALAGTSLIPFAVGMAAGDFNRDGFQDIVVAVDDSLQVILGNAAGSLRAIGMAVPLPVGGSLQSIAPGDFNGDGKLDLAVLFDIPRGGEWYTYTIQTMPGDGSGRFGPPGSTTAIAPTPRYLAVADFNHDGRADLAISGELGSFASYPEPPAGVQLLLGANVQPPASIAVFAGTPQSKPILSDFDPLQVIVKDVSGNPVSGVAVTFSGQLGIINFPPTGPFAVTDSNGIASITLPSFSVTGQYIVRATVAGVPGEADFSLTDVTANVSDRVRVMSSGFVYSRVSETYSGTLSIFYVFPNYAYNSPVWVVLTGLPPGVTLLNAAGTYNGSPYLYVRNQVFIEPSDPLHFAGPPGLTITFNPVTYVGGSLP